METSVMVQDSNLANKFNLKSEAVTVIVGETLAALEAQKQQLMGKLPAAKEALGKAGVRVNECAAAQHDAEVAKAVEWPIANAYRKAMAGKNNAGGLYLRAEAILGSDEATVTLILARKSEEAYRTQTGLTVAEASVPLGAALQAAIAERDTAAKALVELTQEITKLDTEINRLPHTKMLIEASVAKQSLLSTEAGREVYATAQESLRTMAGKDLRATLALNP